jgi:hypothetical protein
VARAIGWSTASRHVPALRAHDEAIRRLGL